MVSKAKTRRPVQTGRVEKPCVPARRAGVTRIVGRNQNRIGRFRKIHIRKPSVLSRESPVDIEPDAQIQRQFRSYFPVVLKPDAAGFPAEVLAELIAAGADATWKSEEEIP